MNRDPLSQEAERLVVNPRLPWGLFDGKTIVITGATGLIGKTLVASFLAANESEITKCKIIALVRDVEKGRRIFGDRDCLKFVAWDARSDDSIQIGLSDYVFHCASLTESAAFIDKPVETIETIVNGTKTMLELSKRCDARMVFLSSMEIYGSIKSGDVVSEQDGGCMDSMSVRSSYPEAKRAAEAMCAAYSAEYGVEVMVARLVQSFGPGVSFTDKRVFAELARACMRGENFVLLTDGSKRNAYIYSFDAAAGLIVVALKGHTGFAYNLANDATECSILEMANEVAERFGQGKTKVEVRADPIAAKRFPPSSCLRLDTTRIRDLGWSPCANLMEMYDEMIKQWRYESLC